MLENLLTYERNLFLWLNDCHTPYWDEVMWLYSGKGVWLPLALLVLLTLCYRKDWREIVLVLLAIVLTITLCDQFASHVCKPLFTRFRPTHHPDFMNEVKTVFGYRGGRYGFISSHAANAFGFAMFLALLFRNRWLGFTLFFWATVNAYSRIYLGVHFLGTFALVAGFTLSDLRQKKGSTDYFCSLADVHNFIDVACSFGTNGDKLIRLQVDKMTRSQTS